MACEFTMVHTCPIKETYQSTSSWCHLTKRVKSILEFSEFLCLLSSVCCMNPCLPEGCIVNLSLYVSVYDRVCCCVSVSVCLSLTKGIALSIEQHTNHQMQGGMKDSLQKYLTEFHQELSTWLQLALITILQTSLFIEQYPHIVFNIYCGYSLYKIVSNLYFCSFQQTPIRTHTCT